MPIALLLALGCSSGKPRGVEDARPPVRGEPTVADAPAGHAVAGELPAPGRAARTGDVQVRVEWKDVPVAARASPGRTACGSPRTAAVAPTTTWGIPGVLVIVDGAPVEPGPARVVVADCTLAPGLAVAASLVIASAVERPVEVRLARRGDVGRLDRLEPSAPRRVRLPIAGHAVAVALERGGIYEVSTSDREPESAWIVATRGAVTEANGQVIVRDLALGGHAVTAWLPPRGGQPARHGRGTVTVVADELAEVTLELRP